MDYLNKERLNPWFSVWTKPRATIQQIVENNPKHFVCLLVVLASITGVFEYISIINIGYYWSFLHIMVYAAVLGCAGGVTGLYISGIVLRWTGRWIGGSASSIEIRAAIAWSSVPCVVNTLLWIPQITFFGKGRFISIEELLPSSAGAAVSISFIPFIQFIFYIWSFFLMCKSLGQVQGFTAWKAFGNFILAGLIIVAPVALILLYFYPTFFAG